MAETSGANKERECYNRVNAPTRKCTQVIEKSCALMNATIFCPNYPILGSGTLGVLS